MSVITYIITILYVCLMCNYFYHSHCWSFKFPIYCILASICMLVCLICIFLSAAWSFKFTYHDESSLGGGALPGCRVNTRQTYKQNVDHRVGTRPNNLQPIFDRHNYIITITGWLVTVWVGVVVSLLHGGRWTRNSLVATEADIRTYRGEELRRNEVGNHACFNACHDNVEPQSRPTAMESDYNIKVGESGGYGLANLAT